MRRRRARRAVAGIAAFAMLTPLAATASIHPFPEVPLSDISAAASAYTPAIATGDRSSLVVWSDLGSGGWDILAARVDLAGAPLDPIPIVVSAAPGAQVAPAVAWNGTEFFVVWEDRRAGAGGGWGDIYAARVRSDGTVRDPAGLAIRATPGWETTPSVAWNGSLYLAAWVGDHGDRVVQGARITPDGVPLDHADTWGYIGLGRGLTTPQVASDGVNFLVVWSATEGPNLETWAVRATRITPARVNLDGTTGIDVVPVSGSQRWGKVAYGNGVYAVVVEDDRDAWAAGWNIRVGFIRSDGTWAGQALLEGSPGDQNAPSIAWNGGAFTTAWFDSRFEANRVTIAELTTNDPPVSLETTTSLGTGPLDRHLALAGGLYGRTLLAYARTTGAGRHPFLRAVDIPPNDAMSRARIIAGPAGSVSMTTNGATAEPGEPPHGGTAASASVWTRWVAPATQTFTFDASASDFGARIGVYRSALPSEAVRSAGIPDQPLAGRVDFDAIEGEAYLVAVDGSGGTAVLGWGTPPETTITGGPQEGSYTNQTSATFTFSSNRAASFRCSPSRTEASTSCTSPHRINDLSEGPASFCVRAVGPDGITDPSAACRSWTVDTTPPAVTFGPRPGVCAFGVFVPSPFVGNDVTVVNRCTFTIEANDLESAITLIEVFEDGVLRASSARSPFEFSYAPSSPGSHAIRVVAHNGAGTSGMLRLNILGVP